MLLVYSVLCGTVSVGGGLGPGGEGFGEVDVNKVRERHRWALSAVGHVTTALIEVGGEWWDGE